MCASCKGTFSKFNPCEVVENSWIMSVETIKHDKKTMKSNDLVVFVEMNRSEPLAAGMPWSLKADKMAMDI